MFFHFNFDIALLLPSLLLRDHFYVYIFCYCHIYYYEYVVANFEFDVATHFNLRTEDNLAILQVEYFPIFVGYKTSLVIIV